MSSTTRRNLLAAPLGAAALWGQPGAQGPKDKKTILLVEADMADAEWGAGGLMFKALRDGHRVVVAQMVSDYSNWPSTQGKEEQVRQGLARIAKEMGVIQIPLGYKYHHAPADLESKRKIAEICAEYEPDIVVTHVDTDYWSDHANTARAAKDGALFSHGYLARPVKRPELILAYSVAPNQTYEFRPDTFVDITDVIDRVAWVHNEIEFLVSGGPRHTASLTLEGPAAQGYPKKLSLGSHAETVLALDRRWGAMCGVRFAEAFQSIIHRPQKLW